MTTTFASDYSFGISSEIANHTLLEKVFKTSFTRRGGMSIFDFDNIDMKESKVIYAELKTRRINHNQYPTALIGANKVEYASKNPNMEYWFVYRYLDGIYGIKYEKAKFDTYDHSHFQRSERSDCYNYAHHCYYIPHSDLKRLDIKV